MATELLEPIYTLVVTVERKTEYPVTVKLSPVGKRIPIYKEKAPFYPELNQGKDLVAYVDSGYTSIPESIAMKHCVKEK